MKIAFYSIGESLIKIGYTDSAVSQISIVNTADSQNCSSHFSDAVFNQITECLDGKRITFDFPYNLSGTGFQKAVWREIAKIPYGETLSYKDIAVAISKPGSALAVGGACNKNPNLFAAPCHRVIGLMANLLVMLTERL